MEVEKDSIDREKNGFNVERDNVDIDTILIYLPINSTLHISFLQPFLLALGFRSFPFPYYPPILSSQLDLRKDCPTIHQVLLSPQRWRYVWSF